MVIFRWTIDCLWRNGTLFLRGTCWWIEYLIESYPDGAIERKRQPFSSNRSLWIHQPYGFLIQDSIFARTFCHNKILPSVVTVGDASCRDDWIIDASCLCWQNSFSETLSLLSQKICRRLNDSKFRPVKKSMVVRFRAFTGPDSNPVAYSGEEEWE
jgi:hypothetical protein